MGETGQKGRSDKNNFAKGTSSPTAVGRAKGKGKGGGRARLVTEQKRGSIW